MRAFVHLGVGLIYIAYLDEFGHVGPYVARGHPRHNDSPVFGFAGFLMPAEEVRAFGTWFFQRKCELLAHELRRSRKHPAVWEKKGSSLYRAASMTRYPALRAATNRLLNRIARTHGRVFYVGVRKKEPARHDSNALYEEMLREAVARIDAFCREDCGPAARFLLALDEHPSRDAVLSAVARDMYGPARDTEAADRAAFPPRESSLPDGAGGGLDCRAGGPPRRVLEGTGVVAGERGLPALLRAPSGRRAGQKRHWRLTCASASSQTFLGAPLHSAAQSRKLKRHHGRHVETGRDTAVRVLDCERPAPAMSSVDW